MNGKTRDGLWIVVGAYLAYTGGQLIMDVLGEKPEGYIGFVVAGVLYVCLWHRPCHLCHPGSDKAGGRDRGRSGGR